MRNYAAERALPILESAADAHPLLDVPKSTQVAPKVSASPSPTSKPVEVDPLSSEVVDDPLGASASFDDPLSAALNAALTKTSDTMLTSSSSSSLLRSSSSYGVNSYQSTYQSKQDDDSDQKILFAPRKAGILTKYTTTETITIPGFVAGVGRST